MNRFDYEELHADEPYHRPKYKRRRSSCNDGRCGDMDDCPRCAGIPEYEDEEDV